MPKTSEFDRPIAWDENGEPDLWDHDTIEGRARIQKRIAEARGAEIALSSGTLIARVDAQIAERFKKEKKNQETLMEALAEVIGKKFKEERAKLEADFRELKLEIDENLFTATKRFDRLSTAMEERQAEAEARIERKEKANAGTSRKANGRTIHHTET